MASLSLRFLARFPSEQEIRTVCRRWLDMKQELGEPVTPVDLRMELVPLLMRLYQFEVL